MAAYQRNGARLGWLLIAGEQAMESWEPGADSPQQTRRLEAASRFEWDPQFPLSWRWILRDLGGLKGLLFSPRQLRLAGHGAAFPGHGAN